MRPQLFRAAARSFRVPKLNKNRTFVTTTPRSAEVELTIGGIGRVVWIDEYFCADICEPDGKKVSVEGRSNFLWPGASIPTDTK